MKKQNSTAPYLCRILNHIGTIHWPLFQFWIWTPTAYTAPRRLQHDLDACQFDCILQSPLRLVLILWSSTWTRSCITVFLNVAETLACWSLHSTESYPIRSLTFFKYAITRCGSSISHMLLFLGNSPAKLLRKTDAVKMSTPGPVYK